MIDPIELPFALNLRPKAGAPVLRAVQRDAVPAAGATLRGRFLLLLELLDSEEVSDAAFFSRDLVITGDTEAVVLLRNALDDIDGSVAEDAAAMFGLPGKAILEPLDAMKVSRTVRSLDPRREAQTANRLRSLLDEISVAGPWKDGPAVVVLSGALTALIGLGTHVKSVAAVGLDGIEVSSMQVVAGTGFGLHRTTTLRVGSLP